MAKRFLVLTEFKAIDGMSPAMVKMNRGFSRFAMNITDQSTMLGAGFNKANRAINTGLKIGIGALAVATGLAAREFINLDKAITNSAAKFVDVDSRDLTKFKASMKDLAAAARAVGADTEFSSVDAAGALEKFAMAGFSSVQSMSILRSTTDLATAADTDLTTAVDIATDSLGAFNLATKDAGQLQKNLTRISDVMARTTVTANTNLTDMFDAVKMGGPAFTAAGQDVETFSTMVGTLANAGIKGGDAGTALRNIMLRLASPTGEAAELLDFMGIKTQDASGNFLDAVDILGQFERATKSMGTAQKSAVLSTIFGERTVTGFNILLNQGSEALGKYREDLYASAGAASQMAGAIRTGLGNQIEILKSSAIELGLRFVEAFEGEGRGALQSLIELVQKMDIKPFVDFGKMAISVFTFIGKNWKLLISLAAAVKGVSIAMGILNIATGLFGATLAATPVGWILAGAAALAAAIALLVLNWDAVTAAVGGFINFVKENWFNIIMGVGQSINRWLLAPINFVIDAIVGLLTMASKIPGIGPSLAKAAAAVSGVRANINTALTGNANAYGAAGAFQDMFSSADTPTPKASPSSSGGGVHELIIDNKTDNPATLKSPNSAKGIKVGMTHAFNF